MSDLIWRSTLLAKSGGTTAPRARCAGAYLEGHGEPLSVSRSAVVMVCSYRCERCRGRKKGGKKSQPRAEAARSVQVRCESGEVRHVLSEDDSAIEGLVQFNLRGGRRRS